MTGAIGRGGYRRNVTHLSQNFISAMEVTGSTSKYYSLNCNPPPPNSYINVLTFNVNVFEVKAFRGKLRLNEALNEVTLRWDPNLIGLVSL